MSAVGAPTGVALEAARPAPATGPPVGMWRRRIIRLKWGVGAALVLLVVILSALLAPWISPHDPLAVDIRHRLAPPVWMAGGTTSTPSTRPWGPTRWAATCSHA